MKNLNDLDRSVVYLKLYAEDPREDIAIKPLGRATGFIWKKEALLFLVTNWHVLAGRDHDTGCRQKDLPRFVEIIYISNTGLIVRQTIELYSKTNFRVWIQSLKNKTHLFDVPETDIAMLPLENALANTDLCPLNEILAKNSARNDVLFEATMPLFIVGYPIELDVSTHMDDPSWVSGSVSTIPHEKKDTFWINAYPYFGLSGAPVLWVFPNRHVKLKKGTMVNAAMGDYVQFAGIYSGRMYEDKAHQIAAPLARIWKAELIDRIFASK